MATKKDDETPAATDPTVTSATTAPEYPEGTHPAVSISEGADAASSLQYRDMPDDLKPDPTTVAQEQVLPDKPTP